MHGDNQGGGDFQIQNGTQNAAPKRNVLTPQIISSDESSASPTNTGLIAASTSAAAERRNIYGLPHPPNTTNETASSVSNDHVFAVPSSTASNRNFASSLNGRHNRPHNYNQHNFNQARNHHHHHNQVHDSVTNDFTTYQEQYNTYQKHQEFNHLYASQGNLRTRSFSGNRYEIV